MLHIFRASRKSSYNKRFKRDSQRVAFLLCVNFCDYGVMRKLVVALAAP
ncbi:DUF3265 domain-containing protein [Vibrio cholerae]|nr:DUF3265 domain-containing protein [Vibrio cholerae]EJL6644973.1 DUF3265 domain-containing protein [Vibrio cholerae]